MCVSRIKKKNTQLHYKLYFYKLQIDEKKHLKLIKVQNMLTKTHKNG